MPERASSATSGDVTAPAVHDEAEVVAEPTVSFTLDGKLATARPGEMLISAAEREGTFIPRFCYHPRMKPVGVCRMCLVEVDGPRGATLQPSCFIPVTEGMSVDTTSDKVKKAQDGVLEFLLINHPLDCPVCDKGGECPLQDQTLAYGPGESRFIEEKRHFEKPVAISDLVLLDRERCIQCARCTRFAEDVAGEAQIDFAGRGELVEVAPFPTEPFSSYFSGNTVQICPVGALTATPYRFTARPWDLDQVESTCTTCSVGCRVAVQSSSNRLTRVLGLDSDPVNHGWLCDKGRFDFEAVNSDEVDAGPTTLPNGAVPVTVRGQFKGVVSETRESPDRLSRPMVRKDGELVAVSWSEALIAAAKGIATARKTNGNEALAVIGGANLTNESAFAWAKLTKGLLGTDSVDAQLGDGLPADVVLSLPRATIDQAASAKVVILLSGDLREELPVLFLRLREAAVDGDTDVIEITPTPTAMTRYSAATLAARPGDAPVLARALTGDQSAVTALSGHPEGAAVDLEALTRATDLLRDQKGDGVVVVLGRPSLAEDAGVTIEAAKVLAGALPGLTFLPALRRGNVFGALDMGLAPGLLPGRTSLDSGRDWFTAAWGSAPAHRGRDTYGILSSMAGEGDSADKVGALVLLGSDPIGDFPDAALATKALSAGVFTVAVIGHPSASVDHADVVLPAAVAHERPGTTTNLEGRVSRLGQKLTAPGQAWNDWMIASALADELGFELGLDNLATINEEIARLAPAYAGLSQTVLDADRSHDGVLMPMTSTNGKGPVVTAIKPIDPIAFPGVESVERQGAPPRVGLAEAPSFDEDQKAMAAPSGTAPTMFGPRDVVGDPADGAPHVAPPDSYALRLVSGRRLYDAGHAVSGSPSLAQLVTELVARANPYDLDRLGLVTGDQVQVRSARGALVLPAVADPEVPRGVVSVFFNVPSGSGPGPADGPGASSLINANDSVTDVRLESV